MMCGSECFDCLFICSVFDLSHRMSVVYLWFAVGYIVIIYCVTVQ